MGGKLMVVSGGQYGSEGKGAVAAHLSSGEGGAHVAVRVAGPNAGHTVIGRGPDGESDFPWRLRAVPVAAVSNREALLAVAAGSEVDMMVLKSEVAALDAAGYNVTDRLFVDAQATMLVPDHIDAEVIDGLQDRIGSTAKGIGAARSERIWRRAGLVGGSTDVADLTRTILRGGGSALIEGTQGYGLGLHAGRYPFCTSSDCRAIDFLSMAGISPWDECIDHLEPWLVFRTRPIRVAGNSGPMEAETSWGQLALPTEYTTVTKKPRRVAEWDPELAQDAIVANGGPKNALIALTMLDQIVPGVAGWDTLDARRMFDYYVDSVQGQKHRQTIEGEALMKASQSLIEYEDDLGAPISLVGTGPNSVIDRRELVNGR